MIKLVYDDAFDNSKHNQDNMCHFHDEHFEVFVIADGVSSCDAGRIASALCCSYAKKYFDEFMKNSKDTPFSSCEEMIQYISRMIKNDFNNIKNNELWKNEIIYCATFYEETNPKEVIESIYSKINEATLNELQLETTLAIMVIDKEKNYLYTGILGDPLAIVFRNGFTLYHYVVGAGELKTYMSVKDGSVGSIDICSRKLYDNDIIILGSDGSNISFTKPGGYQYMMFKKIATKIDEIESAKEWLRRMREEKALNDDFSLFVMKVTEIKESETDKNESEPDNYDDITLAIKTTQTNVPKPTTAPSVASIALPVTNPSGDQKNSPNSIGMEFEQIPAGEFDMGSPSNEVGGTNFERPVHSVKIPQNFFMGKYEVTQKQWFDVMRTKPSYFIGDNLPVENVLWNDVQEFIKKLNEKEGTNKYRLPSEAEWEYAARAGTRTRYSFGDDESELGDYAWYSSNSGNKTHDVGQKKPNLWGLYDMHGNVWEWVQDQRHENYKGAPDDGSSWESGSDTARVTRGGAWNNNAMYCRSANRDYLMSLSHSSNRGFRIVMDL